ncbi:MAG: branched-chain amino acid ABC transporter permease [Christensenellales bacterium]|jgi:branched-chain amino acid transport system permease protein
MTLFLSQLLNGIHVGSIYALIALGYTMVYGIVQLINFAHGDILMLSAYLVVVGITKLGLSPALSVLLSIVIAVVFGVILERVAYRPLRSSPRISSLITAIGVSMLMQNVAQLIFSPNPIPYPITLSVPALNLGGLYLSFTTILTVVLSVGLMFLLQIFVSSTKAGKAMRAVSEDTGTALLMGIHVNRIISLTFAIGSGLAAIGSLLYCIAYPSVAPTLGSLPGIKAFIAAVLGGIGLIPGAMLGGFILGIAESLAKAYISSRMSDAIVYGILIIVLLFKPAGLLGTKTREKV